ncbi:class I SAM-dependent methyltransferase [Bacteroidota bacterium]
MIISTKTDYTLITESPGLLATEEQIARLFHRYKFAADYTAGKDVLEVACGSGIGLGYLASEAKHIIGGDIDERNVAIARDLYKGSKNIDIVYLDAHSLIYPDKYFDVILFYEAIYYLQDPQKFITEASRVLRKGGYLIICSVNKDWSDFHPSPFSHQYFSVPALFQILKGEFEEVQIYGAFPAKLDDLKSKIVSMIKKVAMRFHLIPGSLLARAYLKRIFIGPLNSIPEQIYSGMTPYEPPINILNDKSTDEFKVIYVVATK